MIWDNKHSMIQPVMLNQLSSIFIKVAKANGYENDLSGEVPQDDNSVPHQSHDKGFIVYDSNFALIYDQGDEMACLMKVEDDKVIITATQVRGALARNLANAIDSEYPELPIHLNVGE